MILSPGLPAIMIVTAGGHGCDFPTRSHWQRYGPSGLGPRTGRDSDCRVQPRQSHEGFSRERVFISMNRHEETSLPGITSLQFIDITAKARPGPTAGFKLLLLRPVLRPLSALEVIQSLLATNLPGLDPHFQRWELKKVTSGILTPLISFQVRVLAYARDIPGLHKCFEIYQGYLWLLQVIPWIYQIHVCAP